MITIAFLHYVFFVCTSWAQKHMRLQTLHIFALLCFASAHYKATSAHMKQIYLLLLPSFNVPQVSRQLTDENQEY